MEFRSFDLDRFDAVRQNAVDELVSGIVALGGDTVQLREGILLDADGDDPAPVLPATLYDQRFVF